MVRSLREDVFRSIGHFGRIHAEQPSTKRTCASMCSRNQKDARLDVQERGSANDSRTEDPLVNDPHNGSLSSACNMQGSSSQNYREPVACPTSAADNQLKLRI